MAVMIVVGLASTSQAAPAPRAVVEMDGISVVLVAANKNIHAYVDQIAGNTPVDDASLKLELRDGGAELNLQQVSPGLFVAPFVPTGRNRLLVTLSRAGAPQSEAVAELVQEAAPIELPVEASVSPRLGRLTGLLGGAMVLVALAIALCLRDRPTLRAWRAAEPNVG